MSALTRFAHSRAAWFTLTITALFLELAALYFQYAMKLDPCVMCIYQRVAVVGIFTAGIIGILGYHLRLARIAAVLIWATSAAWGLKLAVELVDMQTNPSPFATCNFLPEFPSWLPLHEWLPSVFMPTGMCTDIPWQMFGITMSEWMVISFAIYIIALLIFVIPSLKATKKR
ncbi:disulfide bond formation protein DsbB [Shewanella youngdeokensis]|uniref:Disulfide bond formation protein B n=1 Tax=Shewanella youngdeokensis TaxID=2999068 RepID=A0ABZ0JW24_9GAMM|nr:disulfide bond formation protein DsbB [Shewanella sp. DAU334]